MERKLFKDTDRGTPQGGIASPLLANVYLHELESHMRRYTALSDQEKRRRRRRRGLPNFVYVRYDDDFVVLCNGTKEHALALREELHSFLSSSLRLSLSREKTKVTHLNDGFDFLGSQLRRSMGAEGMGVKTTIADKAMRRHLDYLRAATAPGRTDDAVVAKIGALNRAIAGWCRYFQYTSRALAQFHQMEHKAFRMVARWLARKYKLSIAQTLCRFNPGGGLGTEGIHLLRHSGFPALSYRERFFKPNPYTTQKRIEREELPKTDPWQGYEERPGMADLRPRVIRRDGSRCQLCGSPVTVATCEVDHLRPARAFKRPVDANVEENLWTLCIPCHREKTEADRQRESRMR